MIGRRLWQVAWPPLVVVIAALLVWELVVRLFGVP